MKKIVGGIFFFFFFQTNILCLPPVIREIEGTIVEKNTIHVLGNSFGKGPDISKTQWLGGPDGHIESGVDGEIFDKTGWDPGIDAGGFAAVRYSSECSHSGTQSIKAEICCSRWASGFRYDYGRPIHEIYVTWWVNFQPAAGQGGQWKMWRLRPTSDVNDSPNEIMSSRWVTANHSSSMFYAMLFCEVDNYEQCYPNNDAGLRWLSHGPMPYEDTRVEYYIRASSNAGMKNGILKYTIHRPDGIEVVADFYPIVTRVNEEAQFKIVYWQNYWGNGNADDANIYVDDIYIQFGSRARVEVGNSAVFSENSHREIQVPVYWTNHFVGFQFNKGSFNESNEDLFIFVINENGEVNEVGFPIVYTTTYESVLMEISLLVSLSLAGLFFVLLLAFVVIIALFAIVSGLLKNGRRKK